MDAADEKEEDDFGEDWAESQANKVPLDAQIVTGDVFLWNLQKLDYAADKHIDSEEHKCQVVNELEE